MLQNAFWEEMPTIKFVPMPEPAENANKCYFSAKIGIPLQLLIAFKMSCCFGHGENLDFLLN